MLAVDFAQRRRASFLHVESLTGTYPYFVVAVGKDEAHIVAGQQAILLIILMAGHLAVAVFHLDTARIGIPKPGVAIGGEHAVAIVFLVVAIGDESHETSQVGVVATIALALQADEEQSVGVLIEPPQSVAQQQCIVSTLGMAQNIGGVTIIAAQPIRSSHPNISLWVLYDIDDGVAGQSIFCVQVTVFQFHLCPCRKQMETDRDQYQ